MSSQDMQFADPEWRPPEEREVNANQRETLPPRPINVDRGDQPQWQTTSSSPEQGYLGQGYAGSQPQTTWAGRSRPRPRRRGSPWLWIILAFIILALMSGSFGRGFGGDGRSVPQNGFREQSQSFTFNGASAIVIVGGTGDIRVHTGGSGNNVTIQETTDGGANVAPTKNGNTVSVNVDQGSDTSFDVIVPSNENLQLTTTDGAIEVDGVNGQITLQSGNGDVTANNDVLTGSSALSSNSGSVTFSGSIGSGNYQFQSNNGSIDVTLPGNSNFHVDASTNSGSITSSDFSSVKNTGTAAHGDVGNPSTAKQTTLTLTNNSGDITLRASP